MAKEKPTKWSVQKTLTSLAQDRRFMSIVNAWTALSSDQKDELVGMVETWTDNDGE
jgi:hypothetical protein